MYWLSIIYNNKKKSQLQIKPTETVLEQMLEKNINLPFSCEIGTCGICKVKLLKGNVIMENTSGLTDKELEENYILTCQSYMTEDSEIEILENLNEKNE